MITKVQFFSFIACFTEPFLIKYQSDDLLITFMYGDLEALVKNILKIFIKSSAISNCKSGAELLEININGKGNYIKTKDIAIGFAAETSVAKLKKKDIVKYSNIFNFKEDYRVFGVNMVSELFER